MTSLHYCPDYEKPLRGGPEAVGDQFKSNKDATRATDKRRDRGETERTSFHFIPSRWTGASHQQKVIYRSNQRKAAA